jgi:hypothetical protein
MSSWVTEWTVQKNSHSRLSILIKTICALVFLLCSILDNYSKEEDANTKNDGCSADLDAFALRSMLLILTCYLHFDRTRCICSFFLRQQLVVFLTSVSLKAPDTKSPTTANLQFLHWEDSLTIGRDVRWTYD